MDYASPYRQKQMLFLKTTAMKMLLTVTSRVKRLPILLIMHTNKHIHILALPNHT